MYNWFNERRYLSPTTIDFIRRFVLRFILPESCYSWHIRNSSNFDRVISTLRNKKLNFSHLPRRRGSECRGNIGTKCLYLLIIRLKAEESEIRYPIMLRKLKIQNDRKQSRRNTYVVRYVCKRIRTYLRYSTFELCILWWYTWRM